MSTTPNRPDVGEALRALQGPLAADIDTMRDVYMTRAQREAYDRILARLSPPAPAGDAVLVPREPSEAMVDAGRLALKDGAARFPVLADEVAAMYQAMLAAAPAPAGGRELLQKVQQLDIEAVGIVRKTDDDETYVEWLGEGDEIPEGVVLAIVNGGDDIPDGYMRAYTAPPAEAREPVGDAERDAASIIDALIQCAEVGRYDGKTIGAAKDWLSQHESRTAQPRDTPRDSGDAR